MLAYAVARCKVDDTRGGPGCLTSNMQPPTRDSVAPGGASRAFVRLKAGAEIMQPAHGR